MTDVKVLRRSIISDLIAVKGHLDKPYPDDPRWTPWTRFVERALRDVDELANEARAARRETDTLPNEEEQRRSLMWLMDVQRHGSPLERRFAATVIQTLAGFEAAWAREDVAKKVAQL